MASGASGAELANIINEAALRAVRSGRIEDLGEPDVADDGVDNERVFPRARHVIGVVGLVEGDGLVEPV